MVDSLYDQKSAELIILVSMYVNLPIFLLLHQTYAENGFPVLCKELKCEFRSISACKIIYDKLALLCVDCQQYHRPYYLAPLDPYIVLCEIFMSCQQCRGFLFWLRFNRLYLRLF